jgi:hypothetical protein
LGPATAHDVQRTLAKPEAARSGALRTKHAVHQFSKLTIEACRRSGRPRSERQATYFFSAAEIPVVGVAAVTVTSVAAFAVGLSRHH